MKYFNDGSKVNFVDDNNVFIGYDLSSQCCESANFAFSRDETSKEHDSSIQNEISNYIFDTTYFEEEDYYEGSENHYVRFKLILPGWKPGNKSLYGPIYLILSNNHNGYYVHGFEVKVNGEIFNSGTI